MKRFVVSALILLLIAGSGLLYVRSQQRTPVAHTTVTTRRINDATADQYLALVNAERAKVSVKPLTVDQRLVASASRKGAELVVEGWDSTPHVSNGGKHGFEYAHEAVPECKYTSENLLSGATTAKDGMNWWIHSPAHYKALTNPKFDTTGISLSGTFVVQHFCDL